MLKTNSETKNPLSDFSLHPQWNHKTGWKNVLNNLRLLVQPIILLWSLLPWLDILLDRYLLLGFHNFIDAINRF